MESGLVIQWGNVAALKLFLVSTLLFPGILGRGDVYQAFTRILISYLVSFGPFAALVYILYQVSNLK